MTSNKTYYLYKRNEFLLVSEDRDIIIALFSSSLCMRGKIKDLTIPWRFKSRGKSLEKVFARFLESIVLVLFFLCQIMPSESLKKFKCLPLLGYDLFAEAFVPTVQRSHGILFYYSPRQNLHLHQTLKCYANCLDGFCLKNPKWYSYRPGQIMGFWLSVNSTDDEVAFRLDGEKIPIEMNEEKKSN